MTICDDKKCFGCALCVTVCNKGAIDISDENGFYRPIIDETKCLNCGRCVNACPSNRIEQEMISDVYLPIECLAAINSDYKKRYCASSGGVARLLAESHIKSGGFVVGVAFNGDSCEAEFRLFNSLDDLKEMSGSLYVQTNKKKIYEEIRTAIKEKPGLFIGVPCDIFSFKTYLDTISRDAKQNVFFVDLLCRGGASTKCFKSHVNYVRKSNKLTKCSFRGGDYDCCFTLYKNNKVIYQGEQLRDPYFKAFMRHSLYQNVCFSCPFAGKARTGDITLGDFWGLDKEVENRLGGQKNGISLIGINNDNGKRLIEQISTSLKSEVRSYEEAKKGNSTLQYPTEKPTEYEELWQLINRNGFMNAIETIYGDDYFEICRSWKDAFKERKKYIFKNKIKEKYVFLYSLYSKVKKNK